MIAIERNRFIFRTLQIWFSDIVYDVPGYDSVVFGGVKSRIEENGFTRGEYNTLVVDLSQDLDIIWNNMDRKSCRYSIKKAELKGVRILINRHHEEFYEIYRTFLRRTRFQKLPEQLEVIKKHGTLFVAELDGEILGGHVYLMDDNVMMHYLAATRRLDVDGSKRSIIGNASHLIHWEAMKLGKEGGLKEFDLGGVGENPKFKSINLFKESFGGSKVTRYLYHRDYSRTYRLARFLFNRF